MKKGEIYYCDLGNGVGSEQGGFRPVLIVQGSSVLQNSTNVIVAPITTKRKPHTHLPHMGIDCLPQPSVALFEQIRSVSKERIGRKMATISENEIENIATYLLKIL